MKKAYIPPAVDDDLDDFAGRIIWSFGMKSDDRDSVTSILP